MKMFYHKSWKPVYFGVKGHEKAQKTSAGGGLGTIVSAGIF